MNNSLKVPVGAFFYLQSITIEFQFNGGYVTNVIEYSSYLSNVIGGVHIVRTAAWDRTHSNTNANSFINWNSAYGNRWTMVEK
ncbi:hypothetical protein D3C73_638240 [compost metagenome]